MKSFAVLLILPAVAYGALIFGGADTAKRCGEALVNGTVKDTVPDADNCSQYYVCSNWFQSKMRCKKGKHFSATEKKCVDPCDAACDSTLICTTTAEPGVSTEAATAPITTTSSAITVTDAPADNATVSDVQVTDAPATNTSVPDVPSTDAPATNATMTDAPLSDAPATNATVTDAQTTDAPATNAPATDSPATDALASTAAKSSDEVTETSTPFWQTIAKHFNEPPSTIPGATA